MSERERGGVVKEVIVQCCSERNPGLEVWDPEKIHTTLGAIQLGGSLGGGGPPRFHHLSEGSA